jgi:hypothetical protein
MVNNDHVTVPTQQQLDQIQADRDAYVARWLIQRPSVDLREALTAAFSAGVHAGLTRTE